MAIKIHKRQAFIFTSGFLTLGLLLLRNPNLANNFLLVVALTFFSLSLSIFSLRHDLKGVEFFTLLFLPVSLTVGTAYILSFLPKDIPLWYLILAAYPFLMYITLLSENIFNVAAIKTIPLLKASYTVASLITVMTSYLIYTAIYKPNLGVPLQLGLVFMVTTLLVLQYLWALTLEKSLKKSYVVCALLLGFLLTQLAFSISFFPLKSFLRALVLSTSFYIGLGMAQNYFRKSLTPLVILEYFIVSFLVGGALLIFR